MRRRSPLLGIGPAHGYVSHPMSAVSNFKPRRNDDPRFAIRPARADEVGPAMAMILAAAPGAHDPAAVATFVSAMVARGMDLGRMRVVADAADRVVWAALPLGLAGRAVLLMTPPRLPAALTSQDVCELIDQALAGDPDAAIVQALLDPEHRAVLRMLTDCGFEDVAELIYLARRVERPMPGFRLPETLRLETYSEATHARFADTLLRSYEQSLDCPKLNGRRSIDDVIAGHKAAGRFDPERWFLLSDSGADLGAMLLNRLDPGDGYELVYIGLTPEARGRRLGEGLIKHGIALLAGEGGGQMITACDADNAPARKLYHRLGFGHVYARRALVRDRWKAL